ncbi:Quinol monooxygenase YgiN [Filimonas lacunae]|uniref:Quinol monooxygenase YgiN n=1 Tax=Filimonas lacunae TaxID=477680 RepID=A0A173MG39_9BACT|nr:putative quinol monooxygenase [Filimonas lacunae]BAV06466.1 hypothetical protein FLA_2485 [Filimonas lacunae]SIT27064.1 Quinol monooxygenase YgiN [Filimonas lacunae]
MSSLKIVAKFKVKPANREEVIASLLKCVVASRAEDGNVFYDLTESVSDSSILVMIEEWKSQEAIDFHNTTPHFKELINSLQGKAEVVIDVLKDIHP